MASIDSVITALIVFQAAVLAAAVGAGLWWYKRGLGREHRTPNLVVRIGLGLLGAWGFANGLSNLLDGDIDLVGFLVLTATYGGVLLVALGAGRLIRDQPERSRPTILVSVLLVAGIVTVGNGIYFGQSLGADILEEGPVLPAGRIELPASGVAVTFPADWQVREPTADWAEVWDPPDGDHPTVLYGHPPGATDGVMCRLIDDSAERGDLESGAFLLGVMMGNARAATDDPEVVGHDWAVVSLLAGPATRSDYTWDDGWQASIYNFVDDTRWVYLDCQSDEPPQDRWLAIAETFEFLPEAE